MKQDSNRAHGSAGSWLSWLVSDDPPGRFLLNAIMLAILLALVFAPFLFPGTKALGVTSRICIFVILVASYDLMLGYTGIVSFAHTMFFGIGAYAVAIMLAKGWVGWGAVILGAAAGAAVSLVVATVIGLLSLRLRAIFFSMITLAIASFSQIVAEQWRDLTGGEDGLTFSVPAILKPSFRLFAHPVLGVTINGPVITYYITLAVALVLFLIMLRIVNSPLGKVLQAIRDNEFRVEAMGYQVVAYRTLVCVLSAIMASLAGVLMALVLGYNGPDATLSFSLMIDILLMVVIGGMGSLYGAVVGSIVVVVAQYYLQNLLGMISGAFIGMPFLAALFHPDRWLLWLGILFVLIVTFLPQGIVGRLRQRR
ncbi:MAG: branched-chain amino acid ABC transporter permease [Xanthobacteraceae bacterium]|nr:branched-chain amino acid ABC transporter permease [Xanthobacteraceae bacterium]